MLTWFMNISSVYFREIRLEDKHRFFFVARWRLSKFLNCRNLQLDSGLLLAFLIRPSRDPRFLYKNLCLSQVANYSIIVFSIIRIFTTTPENVKKIITDLHSTQDLRMKRKFNQWAKLIKCQEIFRWLRL